MPLTDDEQKAITGLARRHDAEIPDLERLDQIYENCEPLQYMHPEVVLEVGDRIRPVRSFWAQLTADSLVERLFPEGVKSRSPDDGSRDKDLEREIWRVWHANGMDLGFSQAALDALVMRRSYISVGTNEKDKNTPIVRPESPLEVYADVDPRTGELRSALRRVTDVDPSGSVMARYATLYLPNVTIWCDWAGGWRETDRDKHMMGAVAIAPLVNSPRTRSSTRSPRNLTKERIGRSDVEPVADMQQAATKLMTDMMVAAELVALPLRGVTDTRPEDFVDSEGNPMSPLRAVLGRVLVIPSAQAKALDFAAAQLANFTAGTRELSHNAGAVSGLPPHYMGTPSDNPASAEAIASSESRLTNRAEQRMISFGLTVRRVAQLIRRIQTGAWEPALVAAETVWRNAQTPSTGARADAAMKLGPKDRPIVPMRPTREALGYDPDEIDEMEEQDELDIARSAQGKLAGALSDQRVMFSDGAGADA